MDALPVAEVRSETAYDALQDGLGLILRVLSGPRTVAELGAELKVEPSALEARLRRLERAGLARREGDRVEAVARMVHQTRQEGMVTFLTRYFLPSLTSAVRETGPAGSGFWTQLDLAIEPGEQEALRGGPVQALVEELNGLSDEAADERFACTAVVLGTSDVPRTADAGDRLIETVRRCGRQRATPGSASRAVLTQFDALFGTAAIPKAEGAVRLLAERLSAKKAEGRPSYTVVLGFFAREGLRAGGGNHVA